MTALLRIFAYPHAGGSCAAFRDLGRALPSSLQLVNEEPPGRGARWREPLLFDLDAIVEDALRRLRDRVAAGPFALFGHSMGAWTAFRLAHRLRSERLPAPVQLIVSGARPPRLGVTQVLHHLDDTAFISALAEMGGCSRRLLDSPEALQTFLPILRADVHALDTYSAPSGDPPLDLPILVLRGREDEILPQDAEAWRTETSGTCRVAEIDGGHFFVQERAGDVAALIARALLPWVPTPQA